MNEDEEAKHIKTMKNSTEWKWLNLIKWNVANAQTAALRTGDGIWRRRRNLHYFYFYYIIPIYRSMYFMTILLNGERMKHESAIGINFHQVMTVHRQNCPFNLENGYRFSHSIQNFLHKIENEIKRDSFPHVSSMRSPWLNWATERFFGSIQFSIFSLRS